MTYPVGDNQFEEVKIKEVKKYAGGGFDVTREDGWGFFIDKDSPVEPKAGMTARIYGKGIGFQFRGIFLDGQKVFYRTSTEDEDHFQNEMYGADAAEWLRRWDDGRNVWSISMGGLGPGYEQAIQITVAEILRHLLHAKYETSLWQDKNVWQADRDKIEKFSFTNDRIKALQLSGAQWGAAMSLATSIYMKGPRGVMTDEAIKDRHIQVSRTFPAA